MSELASSDASFSQSTDGSNVCNDGYRGKCALGWSGNDGKREQRALADLSAAAQVSTLGSSLTGPACSFPSSSDASVSASLVRAASAKSSPLMHALVADNHPRSRLRTSARCPRTQRPYRRPPHPGWSAATLPTQQHVDLASEGEFRSAPRLTKPTSQDASVRLHVPEERNFGAAFREMSLRVYMPAQTLDSLFA